ncbi:MAG: (2Fe-2S)-binding protein [Burkholderiaceae bacterium]
MLSRAVARRCARLRSRAPRAPMCLMGVCFDCLVEIDGRPNVQACMVEVREGMRVHASKARGNRRERTGRGSTSSSSVPAWPTSRRR